MADLPVTLVPGVDPSTKATVTKLEAVREISNADHFYYSYSKPLVGLPRVVGVDWATVPGTPSHCVLPAGVTEVTVIDTETAKHALQAIDYVVMTREEFEKAQTTDEDAAIADGMALGRLKLLRELGFDIEEDITTVEHREDVERAKAELKDARLIADGQRKQKEHQKYLHQAMIECNRVNPVGRELMEEDQKQDKIEQIAAVISSLMALHNVTEAEIREQVESGIKGGKIDIQRFKYLKEKELQDELRSLPWKK